MKEKYDPDKITIEDCIKQKEKGIGVILSNGHIKAWTAEKGFTYSCEKESVK